MEDTEDPRLPPTASAHARAICANIVQMANSLSGSSAQRWFEAEGARPLALTAKHGDAPLEERAVQTVRWLFSLFNVALNATRPMEKYIALEFTHLVEHHYVVWQEFEEVVQPSCRGCDLAACKRSLAFSHEVIYKASVLWSQLVDMMFLQCRQGGNMYDASVPSEMKLTYERAFEMRAMLADPPPVHEEEPSKKKRDLELIIAHLLEQARVGKFRKRGNLVYEQKHVQWSGARYATNAWVPASFGSERGEEEHTLESFVLYFCKKDLYPEMHAAIARSLPVKKVAEFLAVCDESDFPFVKPLRNLLSFKNGVYDTNGPGLGTFYEYGTAASSLLTDKAAAKYFDAAMPDRAFDVSLGCRATGWWDIETPLFQYPASLRVAR